MIQIGGVYATFYQEGGILLQKYRDRNGMCIAMLLKVSGSGVDVTLLTKGPGPSLDKTLSLERSNYSCFPFELLFSLENFVIA